MQYSEVKCSEGLLSTDIGLIAVNEKYAVFGFALRGQRSRRTTSSST